MKRFILFFICFGILAISCKQKETKHKVNPGLEQFLSLYSTLHVVNIEKGDALNIRSSADPKGEILAKAPLLVELNNKAEYTFYKDDLWLKVGYKETTGWVDAFYTYPKFDSTVSGIKWTNEVTYDGNTYYTKHTGGGFENEGMSLFLKKDAQDKCIEKSTYMLSMALLRTEADNDYLLLQYSCSAIFDESFKIFDPSTNKRMYSSTGKIDSYKEGYLYIVLYPKLEEGEEPIGCAKLKLSNIR